MIRGIILDLDGTVYRGGAEVPGASRFVAHATARGMRCLFVTNRANRVPEAICAQLEEHGIPCRVQDVLTSAQATAQHLGSGSAYIIGEEGLRVALEEEGFTITSERPDYVIVGFDRTFDFEKLRTACRLIDAGAVFMATNADPRLKTRDGLRPGTGAIVAALEAVCGPPARIVGKPQPLIFEMALQNLGLDASDVIAVGDNLETDIAAGNRAGMRTALLLTGVSQREEVADSPFAPTWIAEDYDELARLVDRESR